MCTFPPNAADHYTEFSHWNTFFSFEPQVFLESLDFRPQNILPRHQFPVDMPSFGLSIILSFFLSLGNFEPRHSYKLYSYKKTQCNQIAMYSILLIHTGRLACVAQMSGFQFLEADFFP